MPLTFDTNLGFAPISEKLSGCKDFPTLHFSSNFVLFGLTEDQAYTFIDKYQKRLGTLGNIAASAQRFSEPVVSKYPVGAAAITNTGITLKGYNIERKPEHDEDVNPIKVWTDRHCAETSILNELYITDPLGVENHTTWIETLVLCAPTKEAKVKVLKNDALDILSPKAFEEASVKKLPCCCLFCRKLVKEVCRDENPYALPVLTCEKEVIGTRQEVVYTGMTTLGHLSPHLYI